MSLYFTHQAAVMCSVSPVSVIIAPSQRSPNKLQPRANLTLLGIFIWPLAGVRTGPQQPAKYSATSVSPGVPETALILGLTLKCPYSVVLVRKSLETLAKFPWMSFGSNKIHVGKLGVGET